MQEEDHGAKGRLSFNTRTPSWPKALYQTLFREGFLFCRKEGPGGAHPCPRAHLSLPVSLTRSIYVNSVSGWKKEPQSSIS